jgi:hypothetical protein
MICPFTHSPSLPAKNETIPVMSFGVPRRSNGDKLAIIFNISSCLPLSQFSVAMAPGETQLTVIFFPFNSFERVRENISMAAFDALYAPKPG